MTLDDGDRAECKELAREIVKEVMVLHIASCPHGQLLRRSKAWLVGLSAGIGVSSGASVLGLSHLVKGLL